MVITQTNGNEYTAIITNKELVKLLFELDKPIKIPEINFDISSVRKNLVYRVTTKSAIAFAQLRNWISRDLKAELS